MDKIEEVTYLNWCNRFYFLQNGTYEEIYVL